MAGNNSLCYPLVQMVQVERYEHRRIINRFSSRKDIILLSIDYSRTFKPLWGQWKPLNRLFAPNVISNIVKMDIKLERMFYCSDRWKSGFTLFIVGLPDDKPPQNILNELNTQGLTYTLTGKTILRIRRGTLQEFVLTLKKSVCVSRYVLESSIQSENDDSIGDSSSTPSELQQQMPETPDYQITDRLRPRASKSNDGNFTRNDTPEAQPKVFPTRRHRKKKQLKSRDKGFMTGGTQAHQSDVEISQYQSKQSPANRTIEIQTDVQISRHLNPVAINAIDGKVTVEMSLVTLSDSCNDKLKKSVGDYLCDWRDSQVLQVSIPEISYKLILTFEDVLTYLSRVLDVSKLQARQVFVCAEISETAIPSNSCYIILQDSELSSEESVIQNPAITLISIFRVIATLEKNQLLLFPEALADFVPCGMTPLDVVISSCQLQLPIKLTDLSNKVSVETTIGVDMNEA